jgi:hypothetical protein
MGIQFINYRQRTTALRDIKKEINTTKYTN